MQVDTMDLRPLPGVILKQFTSRDMVSRWDVLSVSTQATASAATRFLDAVQARSPYPVRALQVDGGSEFMAGFEQACQLRGIRLFVLPPRSPAYRQAGRSSTAAWNGPTAPVPRSSGSAMTGDLDVASAQAALLAWEHRYNTVRPHQALGYLTPLQFLQQHQPIRKEQKCTGSTGRVHLLLPLAVLWYNPPGEGGDGLTPDQLAYLRDLALVILAVLAILQLLVLLLLSISVYRKIGPVMDAIKGAATNVQGTSIFLSDMLVRPIIRVAGFAIGVGKTFSVITRFSKRK